MMRELRFVLFFTILFGMWLAVISGAHAENAAEKVFGGWVRVTPETILQPVPDWHFQNTALGAVTNEYKKDRTAKPDGPPAFPRPTTPEQVAGYQSHLPERR